MMNANRHNAERKAGLLLLGFIFALALAIVYVVATETIDAFQCVTDSSITSIQNGDGGCAK